MKHVIHSPLLTRKVKVYLVGVGGSGSQVLSGLARLHLSLRSLGHPGGLEVTVFDADTVSTSNVGRQLFYQTDVGLNKAVVLVHRVNIAFGLNWVAKPERFGRGMAAGISAPDILISCVDTATARREISEVLDGGYRHAYWLDLGNSANTGQVVLGETRIYGDRRKRSKNNLRLPTVTELFPELLDPTIPEDDTPTCSLAEALEHQELFICQSVASHALQMLWSLFRYGGLDFSAQFINLRSGIVTPLLIDPEKWQRFFAPPKKPRSTAKARKRQSATGTQAAKL